jgi:DNA-binding XRE family transcriptional regulator
MVVEAGTVVSGFTPQQIRAFQKLLIEARRRRDLTQVDAAKQIGVSQTLISSLERGPHNGMRVGELFRVLSFYQIEPNEIARVLGYYGGKEESDESDPRVRSLVQSLECLPDDVADVILTALELMARGAVGGK